MKDEKTLSYEDVQDLVNRYIDFIKNSEYVNEHFTRASTNQSFEATNAQDADIYYDDTFVLADVDGIKLNKKNPKPVVSDLQIVLSNVDTVEGLILSVKKDPIIVTQVTGEDEKKFTNDIIKLQNLLNDFWEE